jgi:ketosteroid isomerase-like protein
VTTFRALALLAICALLHTTGAHGQAPGYQRLDPGSVRAEYLAEVLTRINEHIADWGSAWANDRVEELTALYWEDAVLIPPDRFPLRGRDQIRGYFAEVTPAHGTVEAFMLEFDASGGMSQVYGNYAIDIEEGEGAGTQLRGPVLTVYTMRGRTWRIRSQVFIEP